MQVAAAIATTWMVIMFFLITVYVKKVLNGKEKITLSREECLFWDPSFVLFILIPFYFMIHVSLKADYDPNKLTFSNFTVRNYLEIFGLIQSSETEFFSEMKLLGQI